MHEDRQREVDFHFGKHEEWGRFRQLPGVKSEPVVTIPPKPAPSFWDDYWKRVAEAEEQARINYEEDYKKY